MLEIVPSECSIGAQVHVTRDALLSGEHAVEIGEALVACGVLCFPAVALSDEEQLAFAKTLGEIASDWDVSADKSVNRNERLAEYQKSSVYWHFDGFGVDVPEFATVMSPRILADGSPAATEFANCHAAYEDLSAADKKMFDRLQVVHSFENTMRHVKPEPSEAELREWREGGPPHRQPLVWHHQDGSNSLLLGSSATSVEAMPWEDGRALIARLNAWATQPKYTWRYDWKVGDMVIWNNTGLLHRAVPYSSNSKRLMHRTTIKGHETPA